MKKATKILILVGKILGIVMIVTFAILGLALGIPMINAAKDDAAKAAGITVLVLLLIYAVICAVPVFWIIGAEDHLLFLNPKSRSRAIATIIISAVCGNEVLVVPGILTLVRIVKREPMAEDSTRAAMLALTPMERLERANGKGHGMGLAARRRAGNIAGHIVLTIMSIVWLLPFVFLILQSLEVKSTTWSADIIPQQFGFDNYAFLFSAEANFNRWYFNTYIIALFTCVGQIAMQLAMAYVLSRFRFKLRKPLMNFMLILGLFPGFLTMIILYQVLKDLNLTQANAVPGLIIVNIASSGMGYYVIKGFFDTVSKSLDEAAMIDGANRAQIFFKVILPLAKPIIIYAVLTSFMAPWGDYIFASYIAFGNPTGYNVAVGLFEWLTQEQIAKHYTHFCAGGVVVSVPVITLFLMLQRYYVEGVTGGAVKG